MATPALLPNVQAQQLRHLAAAVLERWERLPPPTERPAAIGAEFRAGWIVAVDAARKGMALALPILEARANAGDARLALLLRVRPSRGADRLYSLFLLLSKCYLMAPLIWELGDYGVGPGYAEALIALADAIDTPLPATASQWSDAQPKKVFAERLGIGTRAFGVRVNKHGWKLVGEGCRWQIDLSTVAEAAVRALLCDAPAGEPRREVPSVAKRGQVVPSLAAALPRRAIAR